MPRQMTRNRGEDILSSILAGGIQGFGQAQEQNAPLQNEIMKGIIQQKISEATAPSWMKTGVAPEGYDIRSTVKTPYGSMSLVPKTKSGTQQTKLTSIVDMTDKTPEQIQKEVKTKDPAYFTYLKAINEGRDVAKYSRYGDQNQIHMDVNTLFPEFDASKQPMRVGMRKDYTSGKMGVNLTALNTAIHHADLAYGQIDELDNGPIRKANSLGNWIKQNVGDPRVDTLNNTLSILDREANKAIAGGVITNADKQEFHNNLSAAQSKEVAKSVVDNFINLMAGRTQPILENWQQQFPNENFPVIRKSTIPILEKHGFSYDSNTGEIYKGNNKSIIPVAKGSSALDARYQRYLQIVGGQ